MSAGRADNYRWIFDLFWEHVWSDVSNAKTNLAVTSRPSQIQDADRDK
jgi:hypothetical protein